MDSSDSSIHTSTPTPSLRERDAAKRDLDSHLDLSEQPQQPSPPTFSSHNFPSRYFPAPSAVDPYKALVTEQECVASNLATCGPAPPFEEEGEASSAPATTSVVAETKAALPRDTKDGQSSQEEGEPPPPYTEDSSSPLEGLTYVMAAAASVITQVQQHGPALNTTGLAGAGGTGQSKARAKIQLTVDTGAGDESITLELRYCLPPTIKFVLND